jgi:RNA polymerase sigma factor (sigma-70 family)
MTAVMPRPCQEPARPWLEELLALREQAYLLAARVLGSGQDAEDVVQRTYLDALRQLGCGPVPEEARAWFLTAVLNKARNHLRSEGRRRRMEASMERVAELPASADRQGIADRGIIGELGRCLAALDEKHRLPLSLCYEQNLSHREAAAILGVPRTTLSLHIGEGLDLLRKALAKAGYAAAPAAVVGALAHTAPPVPATLLAALERLVLDEAAAKGTGAAAIPAGVRVAPARAKGGIAMKIVAGAVLAGLLAAGASLFVAPSTSHSPPSSFLSAPPAGSKPVAEPYAGCAIQGYLDGPRLETMWGGQGVGGYPDDKFNVYSGWRCIRADGRVVTIIGNDYWSIDVCTEGPAASMPNVFQGSGYGQHSGELVVMGNPIEGGDQDCFFAVSNANVYRIWKNKEKGGRWWFKKVLGQDAGMGGIWTAHATRDGRLILFAEKGFYAYADGKLSLLLGTEAWQAALPKDAKGRTCTATQGLLGGDGYYYLGTYYAGPPLILRVSPDGKKAEQYVSNVNGADGQGHRDGAGIGTGWFCGPHLSASRSNPRFAPPDCIFPSTHDDSDLRRVRDGRVSTFCEDGEWRELKTPRGDASGRALYEFRGVTMGPNGTALVTFGKRIGGRCGVIRGIDYAKPTVGPKAE